MKRLLLLMLLPIIGSLGAWQFRSPERSLLDGEALRGPARTQPAFRELRLPSGVSIALTRIHRSQPPLWLATSEMSASLVSTVLQREILALPNGAACCSLEDANAFCAALNASLAGRAQVRLPTEAEWMQAARFDTIHAPYPWGWGTAPTTLLFKLPAPPARRGPRLENGFQDLAGGLWEWCAEGLVKGGAWSERNPEVLRVQERRWLPENYADLDTGFRILVKFPGELLAGDSIEVARLGLPE